MERKITVRFGVRFSGDKDWTYDEVAAIAKREARSASFVVRDLIADGLRFRGVGCRKESA